MNREIHPLTHVKKKKKLTKITVFLIILTIINLSIFSYIYIYKEQDFTPNKSTTEPAENIKNSPVTTKQTESSPKAKNEPTKEDKLNFPAIDFKIDENYFSKFLNNYELSGEISFKNESNNSPINQEEIKEKPKKDFAYYYKLAKKAEKKGDIKSALAFYHKAYKFNPDEDILYKIAYLNYRLKAYYGSMKYSKILLKKNPNYINAYILLAKSYEKLGNIKKAVLILEEAYYNFPNNKDIMRELAYFYEKSKNPYAAADIYEILAKNGEFKDILKAAKIYEILGDKDKALFYYKKALEKDDGTYKLWLEDKIFKLSQ